MPYISKHGKLEMALCYMDLPYSCPFVDKKEEVSEAFWKAAYEAWKILVEDKAIRDLVKMDSKERS